MSASMPTLPWFAPSADSSEEYDTRVRNKFWSKVQNIEPSVCWEWTGRISVPIRGQHYGVMYCYGRAHYTHRLSWLIHFGPIPPGMVVMHLCDNCRCIKPVHLRLGTQGENMRDCRIKGRASTELQRKTKLSLETVMDFYRRFHEDPKANSCVKMANEYGLAMATVRRAVTGRHWRQLKAATPTPQV